MVKVRLICLKQQPSLPLTSCLNSRQLWKEDYDIWRDRRLMLNSAITLAPSGVNRETHRIYEALEAGSIPVIDQTKWAGMQASWCRRLAHEFVLLD